MFGKLLRVNSGARAFAVGFLHRPTSEIVATLERLLQLEREAHASYARALSRLR